MDPCLTLGRNMLLVPCRRRPLGLDVPKNLVLGAQRGGWQMLGRELGGASRAPESPDTRWDPTLAACSGKGRCPEEAGT